MFFFFFFKGIWIMKKENTRNEKPQGKRCLCGTGQHCDSLAVEADLDIVFKKNTDPTKWFCLLRICCTVRKPRGTWKMSPLTDVFKSCNGKPVRLCPTLLWKVRRRLVVCLRLISFSVFELALRGLPAGLFGQEEQPVEVGMRTSCLTWRLGLTRETLLIRFTSRRRFIHT